MAVPATDFWHSGRKEVPAWLDDMHKSASCTRLRHLCVHIAGDLIYG